MQQLRLLMHPVQTYVSRFNIVHSREHFNAQLAAMYQNDAWSFWGISTCPSRYPNRAADCSSPISGRLMLNSACSHTTKC